MTDERKWWLDEARHVNWIVYGLYALCAALVLSDLLYHRHGHYEFEHIFGFHGAYGFVGCVGLVLAAKVLRRIVMRPEDYYEAQTREPAPGERDDG